MNYLAHLFLSPPGEDALLGSLLGDFVKGPLTSHSVRERYGPVVTGAIDLHRKIDSYTDAHPIAIESRNRVSRERRRLAGVMVDMFYDHFLARYWEEFHDSPLAGFTNDFYEVLTRRHAELPERVQRIARFMIESDWLGSYADVQSIDTALNRMSRRLRRSNALVNSAEELVNNYDKLEHDFRSFLPDVVAFATQHAQRDSLHQRT